MEPPTDLQFLFLALIEIKPLKNTLTFFRQIELLELSTFLVELHLQLLFELVELGLLLLQIFDTLLEKPCHSNKTLPLGHWGQPALC